MAVLINRLDRELSSGPVELATPSKRDGKWSLENSLPLNELSCLMPIGLTTHPELNFEDFLPLNKTENAIRIRCHEEGGGSGSTEDVTVFGPTNSF